MITKENSDIMAVNQSKEREVDIIPLFSATPTLIWSPSSNHKASLNLAHWPLMDK